MDPLLLIPSEKPLLILDSPILEDNQYTTESPKDSLQDISPMISFSKTVTIFYWHIIWMHNILGYFQNFYLAPLLQINHV